MFRSARGGHGSEARLRGDHGASRGHGLVAFVQGHGHGDVVVYEASMAVLLGPGSGRRALAGSYTE